MIVGLLKESENEQRIAFLPEIAARLVQQKVQVFVEKDAGLAAFQSNQLYEDAGAEIVSREQVLAKSDLLVQIGEPSPELVEQLRSDSVWLSQY
ncbi:MAG: NAD(P)(+) transhydrogenase (Re/Si-specific) subunit alpha, partial [Imperialibacter sp.]